MKTIYCSLCGGRIEKRRVEDRERNVCTDCGQVHYRNPLPVAASVVLDVERRVLLVKRRNEPHKGEWCLPTGFAELDETIGDAALRELGEETGIIGEVNRLLSVESHESGFYGELLFVCFEIDRVGGEAAPGDDAEELAWFPLDRVPRLAFTAHDEAVRICAELHRDEWAIQDSFTRLHSGPTEALLSDALVTLVTDKAEEISHRWLDLLRDNPSTPTYAEMDPGLIQKWALNALSEFCTWLGGDLDRAEIADYYRALGRERQVQGFPLHEVISALTLLRKEIWAFIREQQALERLLDFYRLMELSRRFVLFFDKALYHVARGFAEEVDDNG